MNAAPFAAVIIVAAGSLFCSSAAWAGTSAKPAQSPMVRTDQSQNPYQLSQAVSNICRTWNGFACFINPPGPVNGPCWCPSQFGPMQGVITFQ
jgi:hypothetical protein